LRPAIVWANGLRLLLLSYRIQYLLLIGESPCATRSHPNSATIIVSDCLFWLSAFHVVLLDTEG
jgi:hypothetical protein